MFDFFFNGEFESFVGVNFWTMIFAWINLLILYLVLKKILFKPMKNMIDSRQKEIDDMYESAEKKEGDAEKMKEEYEKKLERASEESEEILKNAVRRATLKEEEILKEANLKAERTLKRAEEEIELEKRRAINEVKDEVSGLAIGIAGAVIERDVKAEEHEDIINSFIDTIGDGK
jgi:F-type H+-transporting ATPase subunit b